MQKTKICFASLNDQGPAFTWKAEGYISSNSGQSYPYLDAEFRAAGFADPILPL